MTRSVGYGEKPNLYVHIPLLTAKSDSFVELNGEESVAFFKKLEEKRKEAAFPFFYKIGDFKIGENQDSFILNNQRDETFYLRTSSTVNQIVWVKKEEDSIKRCRLSLCKNAEGQIYIKYEVTDSRELVDFERRNWLFGEEKGSMYGYLTIEQCVEYLCQYKKLTPFNFHFFDEKSVLSYLNKNSVEQKWETNFLSPENQKAIESNIAFQNGCSREEAERLLENSDTGTFLLRYCSTEMSSYVLTVVLKEKEIKHFTIQFCSVGIMIDFDLGAGPHRVLQEDPDLFKKLPDDENLRRYNKGFLDHLYRLRVITKPFQKEPLKSENELSALN